MYIRNIAGATVQVNGKRCLYGVKAYLFNVYYIGRDLVSNSVFDRILRVIFFQVIYKCSIFYIYFHIIAQQRIFYRYFYLVFPLFLDIHHVPEVYLCFNLGQLRLGYLNFIDADWINIGRTSLPNTKNGISQLLVPNILDNSIFLQIHKTTKINVSCTT